MKLPFSYERMMILIQKCFKYWEVVFVVWWLIVLCFGWCEKDVFTRAFVKVREKYNYWEVHFLSTPFLSPVNTVHGLPWKAFRKFWVSHGDSYTNRGMNALSLVRPIPPVLPGSPLPHFLPQGFSLGFMGFHLIALFLPLSPTFCDSVLSP